MKLTFFSNSSSNILGQSIANTDFSTTSSSHVSLQVIVAVLLQSLSKANSYNQKNAYNLFLSH